MIKLNRSEAEPNPFEPVNKRDFNQSDTMSAYHSPERVKEIAAAAIEDLKASVINLRRSGELSDDDYQTLANIISGVICAWRGGVYYEAIFKAAGEAWLEAKEKPEPPVE